jgi:YVTN family beta-propeller protein
VDISCNSNLLFAAIANDTKTEVGVSTIGDNGALTPIAGSPFSFGTGMNSNVGVLSPDNQHLFVSNQFSDTITSLDVESNGSLAQISGSPFPDPGGVDPNGMATNAEGNLLYAANGPSNTVTGFSIDGNGALSPVPSSPFVTGGTGILTSLTTFPAKKVEGEGDENGDDRHKGHFEFGGDSNGGAHGDMVFTESDPGGEHMQGSMDSLTVAGNMAIIGGSGTLLDGTPVHYTAVVLGNALLTELNHFAINWITLTGSTFQTSGALTDGYIAVHP